MPFQRNIIRAGALDHYIPLVQSMGGDPTFLLRVAGIETHLLDDPDHYLPYRNVLRAIECGASLLGVPDFGMRLADAQDSSFLGTLWLAIQSARSVRDGLLIAGEHLSFHTPGIAVTLHSGPSKTCDEVQVRFLLDDLPPVPQATEHAVSHVCKVVRVLSDGALAPASIHLRHAPVASRHTYADHLGQVPHFESSFDGIELNVIGGRQRLPRRNDQLHAFVERYLTGAVPQQPEALSHQVMQVVHNQILLGPAPLVAVARVLRLHPRTLQRRLEAEGQTFDQIKETARKDYATELLARPELSLSHIAQLLDFADQAVLTRACQRWFGEPPSVVRRNLLAQRR